jgi:ELWxxDGT repeat protein
VFSNALYFSATSTDGGTELWKYDGTTATRVADINVGVGNSSPAFLTVFNGVLYFSANGNDNTGVELWKYDGTNPPSRAADINPGPGDSLPTFMTVFNNALYFSASGDATGIELWKFDGTTPSRVADINTAGNSSPAYLTVYNNELYFSANGNDNAGREIWKYKP